jgi:hypothetical protein
MLLISCHTRKGAHGLYVTVSTIIERSHSLKLFFRTSFDACATWSEFVESSISEWKRNIIADNLLFCIAPHLSLPALSV